MFVRTDDTVNYKLAGLSPYTGWMDRGVTFGGELQYSNDNYKDVCNLKKL